MDGTFGIGDARWVTHDAPGQKNSHFHHDGSGKIVLLHHGIVENSLSLKKGLIEEKHKFLT
jgi:glucosamine--fructose-6-phosphate aminotransferase (isomerizing)